MIDKILENTQRHIKTWYNKGVDHQIVNRDLSYNVRVELEN